MVLVQILVTSSNNNSYFVVPISGKCSIRILNVQYYDNSGSARAIQLRSDLLYFPYSSAKYLTWLSNATGNMNVDQGFKEYNLQNVVLQGQLLLNVVDIATGITPVGFGNCIVSMQVESINENFNSHQS